MLIRELSEEECYSILANARMGRLACAHENQPYVVPIYFVYHESDDGQRITYSWTTLGQKIRWMRTNPLVCLECDEVKSPDQWLSVVAFGRFQELTDGPETGGQRMKAFELLKQHNLWWEPGASSYRAGLHPEPYSPIYYRILIDRITGRQAVPDSPRPPVTSREAWTRKVMQKLAGRFRKTK
jgi:nitroimidazol reductase NimA-like FMN-containing flavoprotein (pyridoxamine 5'-phosphate oxidase superfamily)